MKYACAYNHFRLITCIYFTWKIFQINKPLFINMKASLDTCFLSHLLIAGCDIGVQISVRLYVRASVNIYVEVWFSRHQ